MPDLFAVSKHFDDMSIFDAYTGDYAFKGQFSSFQEAAPDGTTSSRRVLSVSPDTVFPLRNAIQVLGESWLLGYSNLDGIFDRAIRLTAWMKKVTDVAVRLTPAQACLSQTGYSLKVAKEYLKDTVNGVSDSEYDPFWLIYSGESESASKGLYYRIGSTLYRTRTEHLELSGFRQAQCDELDAGAMVSVSVAGDVYDPITDSTSGAVVVTPAIMFEPVKDYKYATKADPKFNSGDMTIIMPVATQIGDSLTVASTKYQVIMVFQELDAWNCLVRRQ